ncbi:MAG: MerR family DNA-binding transcriptional regulator [Planctomycetes bacterium]|nr:MerR family DNA-binding transcriptional regulator [Planctomycetota bacterium]
MKNLQDYLLIKEAAEVLGVSQQTLRNWEKAGNLRVYRNPVNGYRLFLKTDLEVILKKLERSASTNRDRRKSRS